MNKYEEAAMNSASSLFGKNGYLFYINGFLAGAEHASKEAHNTAIDKVINLIREKESCGHVGIGEYIYSEIEKMKI
jgi:hypothetical protein